MIWQEAVFFAAVVVAIPGLRILWGHAEKPQKGGRNKASRQSVPDGARHHRPDTRRHVCSLFGGLWQLTLCALFAGLSGVQSLCTASAPLSFPRHAYKAHEIEDFNV
jgi:hypothetical protein